MNTPANKPEQPTALSRALCAMALLCGGLAGCAGLPGAVRPQGGDLTLAGRAQADGPRSAILFHFDHAYCVCEGRQNATFVLIQGEEANPVAAATLRILWRPEAGSTPIDENASNATLQVIRFGGDATEIYSGAGFVFLGDKPDAAMVSAECWSADVALRDTSGKAPDTLGPAHASGGFTAEQNPAKVAELLLLLSRKASAGLGYPRLVRK